jgi:prepilin-type N-terminal cleavage/methylation domain-containing protein
MKKITISVLGEKFEIELEETFFAFIEKDLLKLQNITPKEILTLILESKKKEFEKQEKIKKILNKMEQKMKKAFTMIELIFVIVVLGILAAVAIPRYFIVGQQAHEASLISFVRTLNRTTGEDLWGRSVLDNKKNGSIKNLESVEGYDFLKEYVSIPKEINTSSIDLAQCGTNTYQTVMIADINKAGGEYNITCRDGNATTAPAFELIRISDGKILVSRTREDKKL